MTDEAKEPKEIISKEPKKIVPKQPSEMVVGDIFDSTGAPIVYIVYSSNFLVCIDKEQNLNWATPDDYGEYAHDFGEVIGSCDLSTALVNRIFPRRADRLDYKKMIGAVIGTLLDERDSRSARMQLQIIDERINEHGRECLRMAYIRYALLSVLCVGVLIGLLVFSGKMLLNMGLDPNRYSLLLGTLLGGVGAFITTFIRFQNYSGSLVSGLPIHRLDGFLRIFYGLIAGAILTLAIKGNVLIGFANGSKESQPWLSYFLAMVAGASEILIPNLIRQTEGNLGIKNLEEKEKESKKAKIEEKEKEASKGEKARVGESSKDEKVEGKEKGKEIKESEKERMEEESKIDEKTGAKEKVVLEVLKGTETIEEKNNSSLDTIQ